ncbi:MAG: aldo/keto reductase [Ktedonobacterales bacterium]|nr:aldo/keto reductase [Ktedonobacterales bacterium]
MGDAGIMAGLEQRVIGRTGVGVTFLGFGALEIGRDWGLGSGESLLRPDDEAAGQVLNTVLDVGITLIDTAAAYHRSEERIGRSVADRRGEFVLATKCGEHSQEPDTYYDFSYAGITASIDRSLQLLRTDVIDILQIHFGPDPEEVLDRGETVGAMKAAQGAGKVRFLGASIDDELATRCIQSGDFDVMQLGYNLLRQENAANIDLAAEHGIGVFIRTGLGNGLLTERVLPLLDAVPEGATIKRLLDLVDGDPAGLTALGMAFLHANPGITSVLLGTKRVAHVRDNLALLDALPRYEALLPQAQAIVAG